MAGAWAVTYEAQLGGQQCPMPGEALNVEQAESNLRADFSGQELNGTLYDTYDFTLRSAAAGEPYYSMRGRFVPGTPDAGERLSGTLQREVRADGGSGCALNVPFTATR